MLIAHPQQLAFRANYRKAKCEINFFLWGWGANYLLGPEVSKNREN